MAEETQRQSFSYFRQITQTLNWSTNLNFSCIFLIWNCVQREKLLCRIPHFRMHIFWLADIIIVVEYWRLLAGGGHTWGFCNILIQWITQHRTGGHVMMMKLFWSNVYILLTCCLKFLLQNKFVFFHTNNKVTRGCFVKLLVQVSNIWTATFLCWLICSVAKLM